MGMLDDLLLGRRGDRNLTDSVMRDYLTQQVTALTEKGVAFEQTNRSGSTMGAATALTRTTGNLPAGFFNQVSENAPNTSGSSVLAFPSDTMKENFALLKNAGIGPGSNVQDLLAVIQAEGAKSKDGKKTELQTVLEGMLGQNGKKRQPFGSTDDKNRASSDGFPSPNTEFLQGYRANGASTNNDVSALGNYLSNSSLETGANGQLDIFGAWMR